MQKGLRYMVAVVLLLGLVASAGCSGKSTTPADKPAAEPAKQEAPVPLRIMVDWWQATTFEEDSPYWKELEKRLNIDLKVEWTPGNEYDTKLATVVASGQFPDSFLVNGGDPNLAAWMQQGAFMPVGDLIKQKMPDLSKNINDIAFKAVTYKGKIHGIPRPRAVIRGGMVVREDYLKKVNLPMPTTYEELGKVLMAFKNQKVCGEGKKCYPFLAGERLGGVGLVIDSYAGGAAVAWREENGALVYNGINPKVKDALSLLRQWYTDGLIAKDFPVLKGPDQQQIVVNGEGATWYVDYIQTVTDERYNMFAGYGVGKAGGRLVPTPVLKTPDGKQLIAAASGTNGYMVIPSTLKDQKKIDALARLFNYWSTPEGYEFWTWGIPGVHSTKGADGKLQLTEEGKKMQLATNQGSFRLTDVAPDVPYTNRLIDPPDMIKMLKGYYDGVNPHAVFDASLGLISKTKQQKFTELQNMQIDYFTRIITGQVDLAAFDEFVQKWKSQGGDQITKEMEEYKKTLK